MNLNEIKNKLDACSSVEEISKLKEAMEHEHVEKINELNNMKARHEAEHDELAKSIREALGSGDFSKAQDLIKKQTELLKKHGAEMLSIM